MPLALAGTGRPRKGLLELQKTQSARFAALLAAVSEDQATWQRAGSAPVIADIGCGYGRCWPICGRVRHGTGLSGG